MNGFEERIVENRLKTRHKGRTAIMVMLLFCLLVAYHFWWISPTLARLHNVYSSESTIKVESSNLLHNNYVYAGTGIWQNRGFNLVTSLRAMLSHTALHAETIEVKIRQLQLLYLKPNNTSSIDYARELRGAVYPSSTLWRRLNESDGYLDFVSQKLPKINAWAEFESLLEGRERNSTVRINRDDLEMWAAEAKRGNDTAALMLAQSLTTSLHAQRIPVLTHSNSTQASLLDGPSIAVLTPNIGSDSMPREDMAVAGFELRKINDDNTTNVYLAFYKHSFPNYGIAVVIVRPDFDTPCISARQQQETTVLPSYRDCRETLLDDDDTKPLPIAGMLFASDFIGGCKAASRILDSSPPTGSNHDALWSQEMQNVFSSLSASMRQELFVASFEYTSDGTTKIRCEPIASFWRDEQIEGNEDLSLWQSYRNTAASGVGLDWQESQCLVRLPSKVYPNATIVDKTVAGNSALSEKLGLLLEELKSTCFGSTGSTCTIKIDESTVCELSCQHSGSYMVPLGIKGGSGHRPCFDLESKLETPLGRRDEGITWVAQAEADPLRRSSPWKGNEAEEQHSVTLIFTSDVHGRFFRECGPSYCYPGAPHIASVVKTIRSAESSIGGAAILIDAGDAIFGSQYNETLVGMTMNLLGYEVMALGNHELDIGKRLDAFADLANFPIVSTNVNGLNFVTDFVRVALNDDSILCLLGVSANEYNPLAGRNVSYNDNASVVEKARSLRSQNGCNHTLLVSHGGIEADKEFAKEESIDAVVGGHSHVLMGVDGTNHLPESSEFGAATDMSFPFYSGDTPVAHTGANGRYIGLLYLSWNGGRLVSSKGSLVPLDSRHGVFADDEVDKWQSKLVENNGSLEKLESVKIQVDTRLARNDLCGQTCRTQECLMGNLATDAMVACVARGSCSEFVKKSSYAATVALLESGTLRACVSPDLEDFSEILPWPNNLVLLNMTGASVRKMLKHGLVDMRTGQGGAFLQSSGLTYRYRDTDVESVFLSETNLRRPRSEGRPNIVFSAVNAYEEEICALPEAESHRESLSDELRYLVVVTDWLASGGDGYADIVSSAAHSITTNTTLRDAILAFAKSHPTIRAESRSESVDAKLTKSAKQGISGFIGGAISFLITYPLYTLFVQRSASKKVSLSLHDLFAGSMLGMIATALSQAIYFFVYSSRMLADFSAFTRSSIAAISNSVLTTPLWVVVTHLQVETEEMSALAVAKYVYTTAGIQGLFAGFSMNIVMCAFPVVRQVRHTFFCKWIDGSMKFLISIRRVSLQRLPIGCSGILDFSFVVEAS